MLSYLPEWLEMIVQQERHAVTAAVHICILFIEFWWWWWWSQSFLLGGFECTLVGWDGQMVLEVGIFQLGR